MTIEQVKKLKAMVVEVELIKNEEAFSEKDIKEIAEGQEKIIKKQDELIDYMLSLLHLSLFYIKSYHTRKAFVLLYHTH